MNIIKKEKMEYPMGLKAKDISIYGKITAIIDVLELNIANIFLHNNDKFLQNKYND